MKIKNKLRIVFLAIILIGSPFLLFDLEANLFPFNNANADIGTCCPDEESICIVGEHVIGGAYSLLPGTPCPGDIIPVES